MEMAFGVVPILRTFGLQDRKTHHIPYYKLFEIRKQPSVTNESLRKFWKSHGVVLKLKLRLYEYWNFQNKSERFGNGPNHLWTGTGYTTGTFIDPTRCSGMYAQFYKESWISTEWRCSAQHVLIQDVLRQKRTCCRICLCRLPGHRQLILWSQKLDHKTFKNFWIQIRTTIMTFLFFIFCSWWWFFLFLCRSISFWTCIIGFVFSIPIQYERVIYMFMLNWNRKSKGDLNFKTIKPLTGPVVAPFIYS